jgi:hypothetical protein
VMLLIRPRLMRLSRRSSSSLKEGYMGWSL